MDLPRGAFEMQMLYGMGDSLMDPFVSLGQRVRVYMPYGELLPGMAYLVRRLLENTANDSFLRASMTDQVSEEVLFMNPSDHAKDVAPLGRQAQPAPCPLDPPLEPEPLADFSLAPAREAMAVALRGVRARLGQQYPLLISGHRVGTARQITSTNPANHAEVIGHAACASEVETLRAIAEAGQALPSWSSRPVGERTAILCRAAELMGQRRAELAAWICLEAGKPWREADADVAEAMDFCRYYALQAKAWLAPRHRDVPGEENLVIHEPRGVVAVIPPWNFPLAIPCGMTTAALAAGCPVVLKPAEQTPVLGALLVEILHEAGVPVEALHYLPGIGEEIGPVLVGHLEVAVIAFTGSVRVGLTIHRQAAEASGGQDHVKRVLAEMGGKNAILIDTDADLDEAIRGVAESAFGYAGQKCSACSRVLVPRPMHDTFVQRLVEVARSRRVSPAEDPGCAVPPVIDGEARDRIEGMIRRAVEAGARVAYAGEISAEQASAGSYVAPHILTQVHPDSEIAQQEVFGPVLVVLPYDTLDEAFKLANSTRFALTGGIYSRSPSTLERARREFKVGNLYINRKITGALVDRQPFGGFKLSGIGAKAGGPEYLPQFLISRAITENTMRRGFAPES
jgi:RHH-type proline utilization regulon transcriptional repressor/proline dehydrogenase/delta 1-pyrroline-5-carboxylate dehydrogenase